MRRLDPVRHEEKRQEILAAAKACFAREGFRGASIADICAEAGISPGHLYHYFPGKEAILDAIGAAALEEGARQFGELVTSGNALSAIGMVIEEAKRRDLRADFVLFLELAAETRRNPKLAKTLREMSRNTRLILADFLKKGQAGGLIDPALDPEIAAAILFGILDGARMMTIRDPKLDMAQILDTIKILVRRFLQPQAV
ncbi:MAG TPA: TetR/AcrR family transcriptional regulator [Rhizomicrobium sp.]|jgi:AcrR family transcriptional regulator|nr:TetR/AcrR family transcriptional regulator [Rhizomicrobium sp.]